MTDNKNIEDVTNSPKDWEDFWHSPRNLVLGTQLVITLLSTWTAVLVVVGK